MSFRYLAFFALKKEHLLGIILRLAFSLLFIFGFRFVAAAVDDGPYKACMKAFRSDPEILPGQAFQLGIPPATVVGVVEPSLFGDKIVRWLTHPNQNGSATYIVQTRNPDLNQPLADPDTTYIVFLDHSVAKQVLSIASDATVFSRFSINGYFGVVACSDGLPASKSLLWNGHSWKRRKETKNDGKT